MYLQVGLHVSWVLLLKTYTIMAILTIQVQWTRLTTSLTDKHYSLDSEDDFCSAKIVETSVTNNRLFSELPLPGRSRGTNYMYWYFWVQTIYYVTYFGIWTVVDIIMAF